MPRRASVSGQASHEAGVGDVEVLAARNRVIDAMVGMRDGAEDQLVLVYELRTTQGQVQTGAGVEHDTAYVGIEPARIFVSARRACPLLQRRDDHDLSL